MRSLLFFLVAFMQFTSATAQKTELGLPLGHRDDIIHLSFSQDGKYLLTAGWCSMKLWDVQTGKLIRYTDQRGAYNAVTLSGDAQFVYFNDSATDPVDLVWDIENKTVIRTGDSQDAFSDEKDAKFGEGGLFSPSGRLVLQTAYDDDREVTRFQVLRLPGNAVVDGFETKGDVSRAVFSADEKAVYLVGINQPEGEFLQRDLQNHRFLPVFGPAGFQLQGAVVSPRLLQAVLWRENQDYELWDLKSAKMIRKGVLPAVFQEWYTSFEIFDAKGFSPILGFGPTSPLAILGEGPHTLRLFDLATGRDQHTLTDNSMRFKMAIFSPDGKQLAVTDQKNIQLWEVETGQLIRTFEGQARFFAGTAPHPTEEGVFVPMETGLRFWNFTTGGITGTWPGASGVDEHNNPFQLTAEPTAQLQIWQTPTTLVKKLPLLSKTIPAPVATYLSADLKKAIFIQKGWDVQDTLWVWDLDRDRSLLLLEQDFKAISPDLRFGIAKSYGTDEYGYRVPKGAEFWNLETGKMVRTLAGYAFPIYGDDSETFTWSTDGKLLLHCHVEFYTQEKVCRLFDLESGQLLNMFVVEGAGLNPVFTFSPDNKTLLVAISDSREEIPPIQLLDARTGQVIRRFDGPKDGVLALAFSADGRFVYSAGTDYALRLWETASGKELAALIALGEKDWVVTTPSGLFDASPGARKWMFYTVGREVIELEQLQERYYEPYLLPKLLGIAPGGTRPVNELDQLSLYPLIDRVSLENDRLKIHLEPRKGGIGQVILLLNDHITLADNANPDFKADFEVDLKRFSAYFITDSINRLSLRAYNQAGWLKGPAYPINYRPVGVSGRGVAGDNLRPLNATRDADLEAIKLYALVIGTSNFRGEQLRLNYPDKDAVAFAEALTATGKQLFGDNMTIKLLTTSADPWPRKAEIATAMQEIAAQATPNDVLLVYLSGHGVTYPPNSEKGQFYYLTTDIIGDKLDDPEILNTQAIAQDTLQKWIQQVKARKRILILDACNSGRVVESLAPGEKSLNADQRRALQRMEDRSGMFVLAGSAADKSSFEASRFGHGLLTYSLLNNMPKVAAANKTFIDIGQLFSSAMEEVPLLAKDIKKVQQPEMIGAASYDIGIIAGEPPYQIPQILPVFIHTNFIDGQKFKDLQAVSKAVDGYLQGLGAEADPVLAFWDLNEFSGDHYYLGGTYRTEGETIAGEAKLYRQDKELMTIPFSGTVGKQEVLAEQIIDAVAGFLSKQR